MRMVVIPTAKQATTIATVPSVLHRGAILIVMWSMMSVVAVTQNELAKTSGTSSAVTASWSRGGSGMEYDAGII